MRGNVLSLILAVSLGLPAVSGCAINQAIKESTQQEAPYTVGDIENLVEEEYSRFAKIFLNLDISKPLAEVALAIEEADSTAYERLIDISEELITSASGKQSIEDQLRAMQDYLSIARPYDPTLLVSQSLLGTNSDCDTRSILMMDALERMDSQDELNLVWVPGHAYLRINNDEEKNWETTVTRDNMFDIQDFLNPQQLDREEVVYSFIAWKAKFYYDQIGEPGTRSYEELTKSIAYAKFVLDHTQSNQVTASTRLILARSYRVMYLANAPVSYHDRALLLLKEAYEQTGNPLILLNIAEAYHDINDQRSEKEVLHQAAERVIELQKDLEIFIKGNQVLYFKKAIEYTQCNIDIFTRLGELTTDLEMKEYYKTITDLSEVSLSAHQQSYDVAVKVRPLIEHLGDK